MTPSPPRPSTPRRGPALAAAWLAALALVVAGFARADPGGLYRLPPDTYRLSPGAIELGGGDAGATYVEGFGWLQGLELGPPQRVGDAVYGGADLLAWLGIDLPRLEGVRFGGDQQVRVVLDLAGLDAEAVRRSLPAPGRVAQGEPLTVTLPPLLVPLTPADPYLGFVLELTPGGAHTTLELAGPAFAYAVTALDEPSRLVIDAVPIRTPALPDLSETLAPGVVYRRFGAPNGVGSTTVHLLEIAPGAGEFRVVGENRTPRPIGDLASGAFAAINAGYFDTRTFEAIGLLKIDHGVLSLPSRNRASVGFGAAGPVIDRVSGDARLWMGGRLYQSRLPDGDLKIHTTPGSLVGASTEGVLTVKGDRVTGNTVGPRRVPDGGFAVVYPPDERGLALLDAGERATLDVQLAPDAFRSARYAVEAGPLLVKDGRGAFAPDLERFPRGQRILDAYTQQSAIGVRADGTVLLVVAQSMRAVDLVPLFLSLDATAAMRLDSGSSAMLYADGDLLSGGRERRVVSAIVFIAATQEPR